MSIRQNARWEDMEKGNIDLSRLIKHFESFNRSEGKSPSTLEWYTYVLEFFRRWLEESGLSTTLKEIGQYDVREFILYLHERHVNGQASQLTHRRQPNQRSKWVLLVAGDARIYRRQCTGEAQGTEDGPEVGGSLNTSGTMPYHPQDESSPQA